MPLPQNLTGDAKHYIAPFEVVVHNQPDDCWVSLLGKVLNVTPLIEEFKDSKCVQPLIQQAGKDISNWFNPKTGDICHYVHPITGASVPYCPHGPIPHVNPTVPSTEWRPIKCPWWQDPQYEVGLLSKRVRPIRIRNMLTFQEITVNVCREDSITRIAERYSIYNSDPLSYTWRYSNYNLDMEKNLDENGVMDERDAFTDLGLPQNIYIPPLMIYYNDDLKWEDQ
ncbi:hypothetical protein RN001_012462 [Aquatica leii]|uniref:Cytochrome b5 domain-containing protein 1 n=1 Tax=Aquatica leii TaxID=1421715 RepID=A0AAN7NYH7_9COLE|nr:hypothetical protein RN001_012462 [Aquatica leii]